MDNVGKQLVWQPIFRLSFLLFYFSFLLTRAESEQQVFSQPLLCGIDGEFDLKTLDSTHGVSFNGTSDHQKLGSAVSNAGDINNDGISDFMVASPYEVYVIFGNSRISDQNIKVDGLDGKNGFVISGIVAGDWTGRLLSAAGDINDDGIDDVLIGSFHENKIYVIFGSANIGGSGVLRLSSLNGENGFVISCNPGDNCGYSLSAAGDFDGDGVDDFVFGAWGADPNGIDSGMTCLVYGKRHIAETGKLNLNDIINDGSNGKVFYGEHANDQSGVSVIGCCDINHDHFSDLVIGATFSDRSAPDAGATYVVYGDNNHTALLELKDLNGINGFVILGKNTGDHSGNWVACLDFNGDLFDDILIGADWASPHGTHSGESYLVYGGKSIASSGIFQLNDLNKNNGITFRGAFSGDQSGRAVSSGDINHDRFDDVVIGARYANSAHTGSAYVVYGGVNVSDSGIIELTELDGHNGFAINGVYYNSETGHAVTQAGDINNDGVVDLLIASMKANPNNVPSAGIVYLLFCASQRMSITPTLLPTQTSIENDSSVQATNMNLFLIVLSEFGFVAYILYMLRPLMIRYFPRYRRFYFTFFQYAKIKTDTDDSDQHLSMIKQRKISILLRGMFIFLNYCVINYYTFPYYTKRFDQGDQTYILLPREICSVGNIFQHLDNSSSYQHMFVIRETSCVSSNLIGEIVDYPRSTDSCWNIDHIHHFLVLDQILWIARHTIFFTFSASMIYNLLVFEHIVMAQFESMREIMGVARNIALFFLCALLEFLLNFDSNVILMAAHAQRSKLKGSFQLSPFELCSPKSMLAFLGWFMINRLFFVLIFYCGEQFFKKLNDYSFTICIPLTEYLLFVFTFFTFFFTFLKNDSEVETLEMLTLSFNFPEYSPSMPLSFFDGSLFKFFSVVLFFENILYHLFAFDLFSHLRSIPSVISGTISAISGTIQEARLECNYRLRIFRSHSSHPGFRVLQRSEQDAGFEQSRFTPVSDA